MNRSSEMTKITMSIAATTQTIKLPLTMTRRRLGVGARDKRHSGDRAKRRWARSKRRDGVHCYGPEKTPAQGRGEVLLTTLSLTQAPTHAIDLPENG